MKNNYYQMVLYMILMALGFILLFYLIESLVAGVDVPLPKESAKVVDTFRECSIIRWTESGLSTYKYFLYCPK